MLFRDSVIVLKSDAVPVSVTGTTVQTILKTIIIKAGMVEPGDTIHIFTIFSYTNSANAKTLRIFIGGGAAHLIQSATTTVQSCRFTRGTIVTNLLTQQSFSVTNSVGIGVGSGAITTSASNWAIDQDVDISGELVSAGETITIEAYFILISRAQNP